MDLNCIIDPVWEDLTEKLFKDMFASDSYKTSVTGLILKLLNSIGKNLVTLDIVGNTMQNSTPAPDNPVVINNVGALVTEGTNAGKYAVPVKVSGKNLLDVRKSTSPNIIVSDTGLIVRDSYATDSGIAFTFVSGKTYYIHKETGPAYAGSATGRISLSTSSRMAVLCEYGDDDVTYTPSSDISGVLYFYGKNDKVGDVNFNNLYIGLFPYTSYESYHDTVTTTLYLDEPIRKSDALEVSKGTLLKKRFKTVLNEKSRISVYPDEQANCLGFYVVCNSKCSAIKTFCTHFPSSTGDIASGGHLGIDYETCCFVGGIIKFSVNKNRLSELSIVGIRKYIVDQYNAGTPIEVEGQLIEPETIQIDSTKIPTFKGTTIIEVLTDTPPESMTATYKKALA